MKKTFGLLTAVALVGGALSATSVSAQEAPAAAIPEVVQIDDPLGDANFLNDQDNAYGTPAEGQGDNGGAGIGNATDLLKVWFSHSATEISLNFQTNGDPSLLAYDTYYRFSSNPGTGEVAADETRGCLQWAASVNGAGGAYTGATEGVLTDKCNVGDPVVGPLTIAAGPETTFVTTITFPRAYSPLLADGSALTTPFGVSRVLYVAPGAPAPVTTAATIDNTKRGTDYTITGGGPVVEEPPVVDPPPVDPPVKKGCKKGKGQKKGCKKPKTCPAFVPGEMGVEAETVKVTDAHTAEAPLIVPVTLDQEFDEGLDGSAPSFFVNAQVDPKKGKTTGFYATFEFPDRRDYDLWAFRPDGSEAASSHGFSPLIETQGAPSVGPIPLDQSNTATNHAGETTVNSENIVGVITPDCGGYTVRVDNYLGEGGDFELKLFLGEGKTEPKEAEAEGGAPSAARLAFGAFFGNIF
jgi:hypothetical protein